MARKIEPTGEPDCGWRTRGRRRKGCGCVGCDAIEKIRAKKNAKYYANNKEKIAKACAKYKANNKEKVAKARAKYYANNKEKVAKSVAKYYANKKAERLAEIDADLAAWLEEEGFETIEDLFKKIDEDEDNQPQEEQDDQAA